ncbi:uncharacterized protein JN550_005299 [Neoarthrinium moseri]|uniref:uncharacterized protein n=1 Tax=Neoarthrinium moseri TaxID=1658444 RepID=UPI001FDC2409|nr:uncharacterized protein JN550_005299 [Neoarthrinium moseri]KAI1870371.1 hypothetical protein JN550_005299 [Neoarthrinium moseri]
MLSHALPVDAFNQDVDLEGAEALHIGLFAAAAKEHYVRAGEIIDMVCDNKAPPIGFDYHAMSLDQARAKAKTAGCSLSALKFELFQHVCKHFRPQSTIPSWYRPNESFDANDIFPTVSPRGHVGERRLDHSLMAQASQRKLDFGQLDNVSSLDQERKPTSSTFANEPAQYLNRNVKNPRARKGGQASRKQKRHSAASLDELESRKEEK